LALLIQRERFFIYPEMGKMMKLKEIMDMEFLQKLQDYFAESTGLAAIAVDYQGNPLLRYSSFSPFCSCMREHPDFYKRCVRSDAYASLEAVRNGTVCIHRCHAGLIDFAIPIIVNGEYVASMMCGQIKTGDALDGVETGLVSQGYDYLESAPEIRRLYDDRPVVPLPKIKAAANFFHLTMKYIVDQSLLNKKNIELLKKQKEKNAKKAIVRDALPCLQVTPYFYFNALNAASAQAYVEGAEKTQEILCAMADISRFSMKYSRRAVPIDLEMRNLEKLLLINKIRSGEKLSTDFEIQGNILDNSIPSMVLSDLVENLLAYGLEKKNASDHIRICGYIKEQRLCFDIFDDGTEISEDIIDLLNNGPSDEDEDEAKWSGIRDVKKRLSLSFDDDFELTFSRVRERLGGVRVSLSFPARP
jgi:ligand-binding sensor protein